MLPSEESLALCRAAGFTVAPSAEPSDVTVINTCGFIDSAKTEAIDTILSVAQQKAAGQVKKILVTGCLTQRYQQEILKELPEVDGILGTGSYAKIVAAVEEVLHGGTPRYFDSIHAAIDEIDRVLTTPSYYAYLRIAEGCDNHCAYCVIPSLRGKYRSRRMEDVLAEAEKLAKAGVREAIVIAQDITRYGIDLYGERRLSALLKELCRMDFHWVRLHYLYPDEITDELVDTIAGEEKILKYLDLPIQHCNDRVLTAMNRRGDKQYLLNLFAMLRRRLPGLVLRTSIIAGLPGEDEAAFDELCDFLREVKIERAGVFPYSPEEGTPAARMERVDTAEAEKRAELLVDVQSRIMDDYNASVLGTVREVLCTGWDGQYYTGRSYAESADIDGQIYFTSDEPVHTGEFVPVRLTGVMDGELTGEREEQQ